MAFLLEPLDVKLILASITPETRGYLSKLEIFDSIHSTNTYLLEKPKSNIFSGHVCLADQQTQGRGRFGKNWVSPPGANIYCSLFWRFTNLQYDLATLSMAVAVMVVKMLSQYGIRENIQLKWPNDVLFSGKKLGGILLESNSSGTVVIGIGLNLYLPEECAQPELVHATSVYDIQKNYPERNNLIGLLINELFEQLPVFEKKGLKGFIEDWRKYDVLMGKRVTVHLQDKKMIGQVMGVNEDGELLLQNEAGIVQLFRCGEVSVRGWDDPHPA